MSALIRIAAGILALRACGLKPHFLSPGVRWLMKNGVAWKKFIGEESHAAAYVRGRFNLGAFITPINAN